MPEPTHQAESTVTVAPVAHRASPTTPTRVAPTRVRRVAERLTGWVDRLPPGPRRLLTRELVGFAILGAFTFTIDVTLLALLRWNTTLPLWACVSLAYVVAFGLNFVLNRRLNFKSHAPVGPQAFRYTCVVVADFAVTLGVTELLTLPGVGAPTLLARLGAGACVAVMTYTLCRWWVFRDTLREQAVPAGGHR